VLAAGAVLAGSGARVCGLTMGTVATGGVAETGGVVGECKLGAVANVGRRRGVGSGAGDAIGALGPAAGGRVGRCICGRSATTGWAGARGGGAAATGTYTGAGGAGAAA